MKDLHRGLPRPEMLNSRESYVSWRPDLETTVGHTGTPPARTSSHMCSLIAVLTFSSPDTDMDGKIIWAYVTYVLFGVIYTVVTIPYSALTASISPDYDFRTKLSTLRMACAFGGGWIVSVGAQPFVGMFGFYVNVRYWKHSQRIGCKLFRRWRR